MFTKKPATFPTLLTILSTLSHTSTLTGAISLHSKSPSPNCGKFNPSNHLSNPNNYNLHYTNVGKRVLASAIECPEYEEHLKNEAVELKRMLIKLQAKYDKKIMDLVELRKGEHVSRKNLASSFSCDRRTGLWKINREAGFECSTTKNTKSSHTEVSMTHESSTVNRDLTELNNPDADSAEDDQMSNNIDTTKMDQEPKGLYLDNIDIVNNFIDKAIRGQKFSGFLEKITTNDAETPQINQPNLRYKFTSPITYTQKTNLKCSHIDFYLQGSKHSLNNQLFDGEMQLNCWMSNSAETFEEALENPRNEIESLVQIFSFFISGGELDSGHAESDSAQSDNTLLESIIQGKQQLFESKYFTNSTSIYLEIEQSSIDLPDTSKFYTFTGPLASSTNGTSKKSSSKNVTWSVFKNPINISSEQLGRLLEKENKETENDENHAEEEIETERLEFSENFELPQKLRVIPVEKTTKIF